MLTKIQQELDNLYQRYIQEENEIIDKLTPEERIKINKPIKSIKHLDSFMANGHKYVIRNSLTLDKFEKFEEEQIHLTFGVDAVQIFSNIKSAFTHLENNQPASASVVLWNIMNGIKDKLNERINPVLLICTLFIHREDEYDPMFDIQTSKKYINDWKVEGISYEDFFSIAFSSVKEFIPLLKEVSLDTSK